MYGDMEMLKWNVKNQITWHVIRTLKIGLHAILSSVQGPEGHRLIQYTALLSIIGKTTVQNFTHSTKNKANT